MARVAEYLENVDFHDEKFIGTIAFRSEEITLPDGSKMALGIDDGHWVLVYQEMAGASFKCFEYDSHAKKINVDKKSGGEADFRQFKKLVSYFMSNTRVDDLVTILPPSA